MRERDGVLPIDKPEGPTSHDIVAAARRALGTREIGHTGTLDPFASGLLLLCIGRATRVAQYLGGLGKTYEARLRLGESTDTDDLTGAILTRTAGGSAVAEADLRTALDRQVGDIEQVPPAFSAKKIGGERAHRLARAGRAAVLEPVRVRIDAIRVTRFEPPDAEFEIRCGSGTYIRAVARDAGLALGVGAHLTRLRRTRIGEFRVDDAVPAGQLDDPAAVARAWLSPLAALRHLPRTDLDDRQVAVIASGGTVEAPARLPAAGPIVLASGERLVAVAEVRAGRLQPRKVFV